jgi:hypothetical protein
MQLSGDPDRIELCLTADRLELFNGGGETAHFLGASLTIRALCIEIHLALENLLVVSFGGQPSASKTAASKSS